MVVIVVGHLLPLVGGASFFYPYALKCRTGGGAEPGSEVGQKFQVGKRKCVSSAEQLSGRSNGVELPASTEASCTQQRPAQQVDFFGGDAAETSSSTRRGGIGTGPEFALHQDLMKVKPVYAVENIPAHLGRRPTETSRKIAVQLGEGKELKAVIEVAA